MKSSSVLSRGRYRAVWRDPRRKLLTLESFAQTEEDGGKDLLVAARRVQDAELRRHLERHAADEVKHANLFRRRASELRAESPDAGRGEIADRPYDLSRGRGEQVDAHGFFNAGLIDEMGDVAYVAMLHVAEQRAADLFAAHRSCVDDDPRMAAIFDEILKDEKYHCAYTGKFLDKWREQGRGREVESGLKAAKGSRFIGAWKRLGVRSASGFATVVLYVFYWTIVLPFGLAGRRSRTRDGWQTPADAGRARFGQA